MSKFDLIIFDCDGTLVDSEALHNTASSQVLTEMGYPEYTAEYCLTNFVGVGQSHVWETVEKKYAVKLPAHANQSYIDRVTALQGSLSAPAPGIIDVLESVSKTHKICVASNGQPENVRGILQETNLLRFFPDHLIFTASQVENAKPAPDLFLYAAQQCSVPAHRCLVIEDSIAGATAGMAAGMTVFGYYGLAHDKKGHAENLRALNLHKISENLKYLLTMI